MRLSSLMENWMVHIAGRVFTFPFLVSLVISSYMCCNFNQVHYTKKQKRAMQFAPFGYCHHFLSTDNG
jgi:hypothetical protein